MVIYKIHCLINNKQYIGWCKNFYIRKRTHIQHLKRNNHHSNKLQRAWNKYGENNFKFEIIEDNILPNVILETEINYIKKYNSFKNGYNCTSGGEGVVGRFGKFHHNSKYYFLYDYNGDYITKKLTTKGVIKLTKKELRLSKREFGICGKYVVTKKYYGKKFTKHHKLFKYDLNYQLVDSFISTSYVLDTTQDEIYDSIRNKKWINGFIWETHTTNKQKEQFDSYKIKIDMFDKNEKYLKSFDSITSAFDFLKLPVNGNITKCLKNKQKTAYGYIWKIKK